MLTKYTDPKTADLVFEVRLTANDLRDVPTPLLRGLEMAADGGTVSSHLLSLAALVSVVEAGKK